MDRLERLVNLVAALLDTPRPLTRDEIAARIEGYSSDPAAFRRNFERDKDLLRQMGFPVVTVSVEGAPPEEVGYRIPPELYELPDPGLDDSELAALRLAASAVQTGAGGADAAVTRALRKLAGAASGGSSPHLETGRPEPAPTTAAGLPSVPAAETAAGLASVPAAETAATAFAAVSERRRLRFTYRGETRLVDPWQLSYHRGHWYLAGLDHHRGGERRFRLDRVDGEVQPDGPAGAFVPPSGATGSPPPPWLMGDDEEQPVQIWVDATQAHWARRELGPDTGVEEHADGTATFRVRVTNPAALRSYVLGFLDHAEILGPPPFRQAMVEWLEGLQ